MKKIYNFWIFVLSCIFFTSCNSTKSYEIKKDKIEKVSKNIDSNAYFKVIGTEPFWNIEIAEEKISYSEVDGVKIEFPYNLVTIDKFANTRIYKTVNGNGSILIKLTKGSCSDGMSDKNYEYSAEVEITQFKKTTKHKGCGYFVANDLLSGTWILSQIKSKKVSNNQNSIIPFIEFDLENNRVSGNAGCNGFSSSFILKSDRISFKEILLTRMFCEDMLIEKNFVETLNEVNSYKVDGHELKFYKEGFLEMIFEKKEN